MRQLTLFPPPGTIKQSLPDEAALGEVRDLLAELLAVVFEGMNEELTMRAKGETDE
jgi:hypothetical protein